MIIVKASPTAALMLHIGLVNYLRISNLQKLFHTLNHYNNQKPSKYATCSVLCFVDLKVDLKSIL